MSEIIDADGCVFMATDWVFDHTENVAGVVVGVEGSDTLLVCYDDDRKVRPRSVTYFSHAGDLSRPIQRRPPERWMSEFWLTDLQADRWIDLSRAPKGKSLRFLRHVDQWVDDNMPKRVRIKVIEDYNEKTWKVSFDYKLIFLNDTDMIFFKLRWF